MDSLSSPCVTAFHQISYAAKDARGTSEAGFAQPEGYTCFAMAAGGVRRLFTTQCVVGDGGRLRKDIAFGMRALAQAGVVQLMWTGMSHFDGANYTISKRDVDATNMSPLDTFRVKQGEVDGVGHTQHPNFPLHVLLHEQTGKECCVLVHNSNSSWLSAQNWITTQLPAWDCNCAMFARPGDVTEVVVPYCLDTTTEDRVDLKDLGRHTKVAILPNRATAVFGDSINQAVMRSIYLNFAVETMRGILVTGRDQARLTSPAQLDQQNDVWDTNPAFTESMEMKILKKSMALPVWWDRVEVSEFSDDNLDELQLLAAVDMPANTLIAKVGGTILTEPNKYTVRLAPKVHLLMTDGSGSKDSIFTRLNHSFTPNLRATPKPEEEMIVFKTLRAIAAGEPLHFDYTTTEDTVLAAPFVDLETGRSVGTPML